MSTDTLPAVVAQWLEAAVDEGAISDSKDSRRIHLERIVVAARGGGTNYDKAALKSLRTYHGWPAGTDQYEKTEAVQTLLAQLIKPQAPAPNGNGRPPARARDAEQAALAAFLEAAEVLIRWGARHPELVWIDDDLREGLRLLQEARLRTPAA